MRNAYRRRGFIYGALFSFLIGLVTVSNILGKAVILSLIIFTAVAYMEYIKHRHPFTSRPV